MLLMMTRCWDAGDPGLKHEVTKETKEGVLDRGLATNDTTQVHE